MENKPQYRSSEMPKDLTFQNLEASTDKFSEKCKVGSGGYGEVYRGLLDNGAEIAVKKLYHTPGLIDAQFKKEFDNLMRVQHPNIIRLVGYCNETRKKYVKCDETGEYVWASVEERALCFEFFQRGSLDKYLCDESSWLDWHKRYQIIKGICDGLNYLHNGHSSSNPIYHLDLKPANILLDENMMPKITDFGLARLFGTTKTHITTTIRGTFAYVPPEYIGKRQISKKFDIFSLGIIIIQIMTGPLGYSECGEMPPQEFIDLVQEKWKKRLQATATYTSQEVADSLEEVKTCIVTALRCVETDRANRPTIKEVMDQLNEIETMRRSRISQSSEYKLEGLVIDPLELRFAFDTNKDGYGILQLTNKSDQFVAFSTKADKSRYSTQPGKGVMPPWSKRYIVTTMKAQELAPPPDVDCSDVFLMQSASVTEGVTSSDITEDLFKKMVAAGGKVEEVKLPVVYVVLP
ncbi:unnamed protein product [Urochloa decumbens]|uniref:Protein kinase domain-containing protein n=1 Tax=Urochloa decumbens TaxID=240449 RepID=A0ABC9B1H1_9POAL